MKKFLCALLSLLILLSPVNAMDGCKMKNLDNSQEYVNPDFDEISFMQNGEKNRSSYVELDIKHYYQSDSRWKNDPLGVSTQYTLGSSGCALTSFTMLVNYINGVDYTPKTVNSHLGSLANSCSGICWKLAGDEYHLNLQYSKPDQETDWVLTNAKYAINNGYPYIIGMKEINTGISHFVIAYGFKVVGSNLTIYIHDPALSRNYTTAQEYIDNGWEIHQGVLFY